MIYKEYTDISNNCGIWKKYFLILLVTKFKLRTINNIGLI